MGLIRALANKLICVDASIFIYEMEEHPKFTRLIEELFDLNDKGGCRFVASAVVLTEVTVLPFKNNDFELINAYTSAFLANSNLEVVSIDFDLALRAGRLRASYNLRTPDALHLAIAIRHKCHYFLTNDKALQRVTEIPVLVLSDFA